MSVIKFQHEDDIRRVFVNNTVTYPEISALIKKLYKNLNNKSFSLTYVDDEGDVISVTSDEELQEAFRNFTTPVARFTIIPADESNFSTPSTTYPTSRRIGR